MIEIKLVNYDELPKEVHKDIGLSNNGCGKENAGYLLIYYNNKLETVYNDAMEPEDAIFSRDLSWIQKEIEYAYRRGRDDVLNTIKDITMKEIDGDKHDM